jgi:arginyl-tRNA synthetase
MDNKDGQPPKDGPSKGELKKLAKKAEKAAKKQQSAGGGGGDGGAPAAAPATVTTPAAAAAAAPATTTASSKPSLLLAHASADNTATLKVVWASLSFGVSLRAAKPSDIAANDVTSGSSKKHPALLFGNQIVSGGGNAMVQTLALMQVKENAAIVTNVFGDALMVDEWCEWERTCLRPAVDAAAAVPATPKGAKVLAAALQHLETHLTSTTVKSLHLVGTCDSAADICVVATLLTTSTKTEVPAAVQKYLAAHEASLATAKMAVEGFTKAAAPPAPAGPITFQPVDMNEPSLLKVVNHTFEQVVQALYGTDVAGALPAYYVAKCQNPKHGDYQCTAAMPTFAALKSDPEKLAALGIKSPQTVAAAIVKAVGDNHAVIEELKIQGPGFVMCRIRPAFLQQHVNVLLRSQQLPKPSIAKQTCTVDFSSPNIAKEMHVGHLRSTIIGEAVCRILEFVGHDVKRINHVGDWGTQFGMLIQYLKEEFPEVGQEGAELPNITDLTEFYKSAKQRFDENADFKKTAQTNVVKLQSGDAECLKIWKMLCDVSRKEFHKVYSRLDVTVEECGESFYNEKIAPVIEEFTKIGKIKIEEGGAKCVFVDKFKVPLMLQKSDGGFGYDSTDMAALKYRLQVLGADRIIVITDFSQGDHFKMVYAAGHDIGWVNKGQKLEHIGFGTVQGEDGKRFKTRSGDTVRLVDLLDEAVNRAEEQLKGRIVEGKANITMEEVHGVAEAIGYGAVKYYDLRRNPTTNYKFSYDQMLDNKGNTAVYLLYARVRLESIAAKAKANFNVDVEELWKAGAEIVLSHPSERNLAFNLQQFDDAMTLTLDDLYPYHICEYVYNVANAASDFVTQCKVLGEPEMNSRLLLCYATVSAMHQCFDLLGIRHVKKL